VVGEFFQVGTIVNTHGLRGEVKVLSRTDFGDDRFRKGSQLFLRIPNQSPDREITVKSARPNTGVWLVTFEGIDHINDAEKLKGMELCINETRLMTLPEGTYYLHQLIGLQVFSEEGLEIGKLTEVLAPGANDVYVIKTSLQQSPLLLPAIPDCILRVNLSEKIMIVRLLPGLLDNEE